MARACVVVALVATFACAATETGAQEGSNPVGQSHAGSALALVRAGHRTLALVADADDAKLHAFDVASGIEAWVLKLDGTPGSLVVTRGGNVLVALRDKNRVQALAMVGADTPPTPTAAFETPPEPIGLALDADETEIAVVCGWGRTLVVHTLADFSRKLAVQIPREPRAVVISKNGARAFVTHAASDALSVVSLGPGSNEVVQIPLDISLGATRFPRGPSRPKGRAVALVEADGKIIVPGVALDTSPPLAGYYGQSVVGYGVMEVDEATLGVGRRTASNRSCSLPSGAIHHAGTTYVACTDRGQVLRQEAPPIPITSVSAIAVDERRDALVAWSQLSRTLSVTSLSDPRQASAWRASGSSSLTEEQQLGRAIFHSSDRRISSDGRACATCHPDGRDDGLVWATPDGPRQTAMLAGRLVATAPYGWTRDEPDLASYIRGTVRRLGGGGLGDRDLAALAAYVTAIAPPVPVASRGANVRRGREIFVSSCATCHAGPQFTDGKRHAIGSEAANDREFGFATPSLRFVGGTAPYFHDGRYATLRELLMTTDGTMGASKHLAPADLDALEAFLLTL